MYRSQVIIFKIKLNKRKYIRTCELDAVGKSYPGKCNYFWSMFSQKLHNSENLMVLETLILKQIDLDTTIIESFANCITNVKHAIIVNNEMNKKQWARFALEINRTDKRLQTLGMLEKILWYIFKDI